VIMPNGDTEPLPTLPKEDVAAIVIERLAAILNHHNRGETN
jgi:hypothetical protein